MIVDLLLVYENLNFFSTNLILKFESEVKELA
jgi:hypothetical protein